MGQAPQVATGGAPEGAQPLVGGQPGADLEGPARALVDGDHQIASGVVAQQIELDRAEDAEVVQVGP